MAHSLHGCSLISRCSAPPESPSTALCDACPCGQGPLPRGTFWQSLRSACLPSCDPRHPCQVCLALTLTITHSHPPTTHQQRHRTTEKHSHTYTHPHVPALAHTQRYAPPHRHDSATHPRRNGGNRRSARPTLTPTQKKTHTHSGVWPRVFSRARLRTSAHTHKCARTPTHALAATCARPHARPPTTARVRVHASARLSCHANTCP